MKPKVNQFLQSLFCVFAGVFTACAQPIAKSGEGSLACDRQWHIVSRIPHDTESFTQGLVNVDGRLFESVGGYGSSALLEIEPSTGRILRRRAVDSRVFAEGLTYVEGKLIQLTWHLGVAFVYDLSMRPLSTMRYPGQGWGLTLVPQAEGPLLVLSDGSSSLRWLRVDDLSEVRRLQVQDGPRPVTLLNELEWFDGRILANVWRADRIAEIDPTSGELKAWIDLSSLRAELRWPAGEPRETDLNGIALTDDGQRLWVTGKRWPLRFEIALGECVAP